MAAARSPVARRDGRASLAPRSRCLAWSMAVELALSTLGGGSLEHKKAAAGHAPCGPVLLGVVPLSYGAYRAASSQEAHPEEARRGSSSGAANGRACDHAAPPPPAKSCGSESATSSVRLWWSLCARKPPGGTQCSSVISSVVSSVVTLARDKAARHMQGRARPRPRLQALSRPYPSRAAGSAPPSP